MRSTLVPGSIVPLSCSAYFSLFRDVCCFSFMSGYLSTRMNQNLNNMIKTCLILVLQYPFLFLLQIFSHLPVINLDAKFKMHTFIQSENQSFTFNFQQPYFLERQSKKQKKNHGCLFLDKITDLAKNKSDSVNSKLVCFRVKSM